MRSRMPPAVLALVVAAGAAAQAPPPAPAPKDFAQGLRVTTAPGLPVQQFTVPEAVYRGVARADLGDLRVFNAAGVVVPHALCTEPPLAPATTEEMALQVFPLQQGSRAPQAGDTRVSVQTSSGTSVQVVEGGIAAAPAPAPADVEAWVVDGGAGFFPIHALRLAWSTPDGASQARVRVEASNDLDRWRTVVADTTLLHVSADGRALDRNRIDLPEGTYRYLRLTRGDGPPVRIERVTAEYRRPGPPVEPTWFRADADPAPPDQGFGFDAGRLAPVQAARVTLPVTNMALRVALDSRPAPQAAWQQRWAGDVSSVRTGETEARSPSAAFSPVSHPLWRVRVLRGAETLGGAGPGLELAYHPARLRFSAQGAEPFLVAFGSVRVPPAETRACDELLAPFPPDQREALVGAAQVAPAPSGPFGGSAMLTPPPEPMPVRQIVLWAALLAGAALLVAMAMALLRRVREGGVAD